MKKSNLIIFILLGFCFQLFLGSVIHNAGASNFDRLVLGSGNYGLDPNPTADITLQNGEYITNSTDGTIGFGSANLTTSGTITGTAMFGGSWGQFGIITNSANLQSKYDTITIAGCDTSYRYVATPIKSTAPVVGDLLSCKTISGKAIFVRADTTTANLPFSYCRVK